MHKLAALDAGFLYSESARTPQHIASVQILELPEGVGETGFIAELKKLAMQRIHLIPYFTNKLQTVPFNLDHPIWVRDEKFDIDNHILHAEVPAPGGRAEFEATIARLHSIPMDRSRPLWEMWVLTGLEGGRIAYYNRSHHSCLDGVSGQAAIQAFMDPTPEVQPVPPPPADFETARRTQNPASLLAGAFENFLKFQIRQASRAMTHAETAWRLAQRGFDPAKGLGAAAETAPRTRFNRSVYASRTYATGELPLAEVKSIGKRTGTTVNDVFLAICSGGLRRYLERTGELPDASLIAGCPVSLRRPGDKSLNNQVSMMLVSFASNEADPVKRLLEIARSSGAAKGVISDFAPSYDSDVAIPGLPSLLSLGMQAAERANLADAEWWRMPCNVVVSNVPGPRQQLYSLGARVLTHYPVSIPAHGQGLNITVQSYQQQLFFGITACRRAVPDADALRDDMLAAFMELASLVLRETSAPEVSVAPVAIAKLGAEARAGAAAAAGRTSQKATAPAAGKEAEVREHQDKAA
ncbi:MAG: wax ester/triacylglycerol synthase family O-acyltransferase [Pseudomonadales bacterium]